MRSIALLVAVGLVLAVTGTAGALTNTAGDVSVGITYGASAAWTDSTKAVGNTSLQLNWPVPYTPPGGSYTTPNAYATIDIPSGLTLNDISAWSYWAKAPEDYLTNLTFYLDSNDDGVSDITVTAWPQNDPPLADNWMQVTNTTIGGYKGSYVVWAGASPKWKFDWTAVQTSYGTYDLLGLKLGKGVIGTNQAITTYVDDFAWTVGGVSRTWEFEGTGAIPEPLTMAGLVMGIGCLARYIRRRR